MTFKQAERKPADGAVSITRADDGGLILRAVTDGQEHTMTVSEYNASRLFGMLAMFLQIPLSKSVGKAIKI